MRGREPVRVSVVIPTLNEEKAIRGVIEKIRRRVRGCEIIVVDSSEDDTFEEALRSGARAVREPRLGYGHAIRRGLSMSSGEILLFIDGDGSYDASDIPRVIEPILSGEAEVTIGTRFHSRPEGMTIARFTGNLIINFIFSTLFRRKVRDSQTGLKAMSREAYEALDLRENGMTFSTEVLLRSIDRELRVQEVQVNYRTRVGHSKLSPIRDGPKIVHYILTQRLK